MKRLFYWIWNKAGSITDPLAELMSNSVGSIVIDDKKKTERLK